MDTFSMLVVDAVLLFGLFCSMNLAMCWGELCGIRPHGDKSGLGGFVMVYAFLPVRWIAVAIGLAYTIRRGALPLVSGLDSAWLTVFGLHTGLGLLGAWLFGRGLRQVQNDLWAPNLLGIVGGTLIPMPALLLALVGTNVTWLGDGATALVASGALLAVAHILPYRHRRRDMLAPRVSAKR